MTHAPSIHPTPPPPQVDIAPEEFHNSVPAAAALLGQVAEVTAQLTVAAARGRSPGSSARLADWWQRLREKAAVNQQGAKVPSGGTDTGGGDGGVSINLVRTF